MNAQVAPAAEVLPPAVESPVVEFNQTAAGLAALRQQIEGTSYDCTTPDGDKRAREDRRMCVRIRTELRAKHQELKKPVLDRGRLLDGELNRITTIVQELEAIPDAAIKVQEAIEDAARQERQRIEAERQAKIDREIARIANLPVTYVSANAPILRGVIQTLAAEQFADLDGTSLIRSLEAKAVAQEGLNALLDARIAADAEKAELEAQRAEQERELAEQREQQRLDSERAAAERVEADRIAREQRARDAEEQRQRLADEQAAADARRAEAERLETEARTAAEAHRAAEQKKLDDQRAELLKQQALIETQRVREQAKREQDAIDKATLTGAAAGAVELLTELGQGGHIVTRKLVAALKRASDAKPAPAPKGKRTPVSKAVQS